MLKMKGYHILDIQSIRLDNIYKYKITNNKDIKNYTIIVCED